MKFNSCLIIGAGGIGQFLIPALSKLFQFHPHGTLDITVIDGDIYTPNNYVRQYVTYVNENKAEAIARGVGKHIKVIPEYIDRKNVGSILSNLVPTSLIIPCVDNMATRYLILKTLQNLMLTNYYWVCPGNELETYTISIYKGGGVVHPFERYSNLANPEDDLPTSCIEEVASSPQLLATNMMVAAATISVITNLLDDQPLPASFIGDIRQGTQIAVGHYAQTATTFTN